MADETVEAPAINYAYLEPHEPIVAEQKAEPEAPETQVEVKAEPEVKVEPKPEVKPETVEPKAEVKAIEKPAEVTAVDWKAALKTADKYEALKELGYDDFTIGMLKYKEQTGDYTPYLEVKTVDYSKMTPEQILKLKIQNENKGMAEKALNFKINKELNEKYYLNREDYPEDSEEAIYGQEQMRFDGEAQRKQFIESQKQFKAPEPQPDLDATNREAELQRQRAAIGESVMNNPFTKSLQENKYITIGKGEESFHYPVEDVKSLVDTALNSIVNSGYTDISKLNMETFIKQLIIGKDVDAYEKAIADNALNLSKKKLQDELQNRTPINNQQLEPPAAKKDYGYRG